MSGTFLRYLLLSIVSVAALSAISSAYTVTLTGSSSLGAITNAHSYMTFNLSNSGDGPAQQVAISPIISGATTNQSEIYIPSLNANTSNVSKIYLQNLSSNGTYIESFVVVYNQGSSTFVTLYPCEQYINKFTQSSLLIANMTQKGGKVEASMLNYGPYAIDANVSFLTSPLYALQNATRNETVSIAPGGIATVSFGYKPIVGNYSFPASVAAQYYGSPWGEGCQRMESI